MRQKELLSLLTKDLKAKLIKEVNIRKFRWLFFSCRFFLLIFLINIFRSYAENIIAAFK